MNSIKVNKKDIESDDEDFEVESDESQDEESVDEDYESETDGDSASDNASDSENASDSASDSASDNEESEDEDTAKKEKPAKKEKTAKKETPTEDEIDDAPNSNEISDQTKDEMKRQFEKLKEEYPEFSALKEDIVDAMVKIDPILDKAETFMNKYSKYKSQKK